MEPLILILTGYSGAGKTAVLKALEDIGFFCIDNLPIPLLRAFFDYCAQHGKQHRYIALGLDVRSGHELEKLPELIPLYDGRIGTIKILFLTAHTPELLKRFQETRRKHPLADGMSLTDAIEYEKKILQPLMNMTEMIVDTGNFTVHQVRSFVRTTFGHTATPRLVVNLMSFGFKYGVPQECNFVYDVRALPNPHFVDHLRPLTGLDQQVRDYLFAYPQVQEYCRRLEDFFHYSVQQSFEEGRFFIHVAIGCTGGRHRSVAVVEELAKRTLKTVTFLVAHRDIYRETLVLKEYHALESTRR